MKLFVSDLDGTLYYYNGVNNNSINEESRILIDEWIKKGNIFAIATGRIHTIKDRISKDIGHNIDYLAGNGAEVVYKNNEEHLITLPVSLFLEIGEWIEKNNYDACTRIWINKKPFFYTKDNYPFNSDNIVSKFFSDAPVFNKNDYQEGEVGVSLTITANPAQTLEIEKGIRDLVNGRCTVVTNGASNIDLVPNGVSKGKAVKDLAEYYNLNIDDVIVIGDSNNDISMFEVTKNSYAMFHSSDHVKSYATKIVDSVAEALKIELNKK